MGYNSVELQHLNPVNKDHAIKEAVVSLFLASEIIKPERFQDLISNELKGEFHHFDTIKEVQLEFNSDQDIKRGGKSSIRDNVGFKFSRFDDNGNLEKIFQGRNERNRTFISYHSFNYSSWSDFYQKFKNIIKIFSDKHPDIFALAFGLHYLDEFFWTSEENLLPLEEVFEKQGDIIPNDFFESNNSDLISITEKEEGDFTYFDRLQVKVDSKSPDPYLRISQNITHEFDDYTNLSDLFKGDEFPNSLQLAHDLNKKTLESLLTEEVQRKIGLI